jgi:hypothetical protein
VRNGPCVGPILAAPMLQGGQLPDDKKHNMYKTHNTYNLIGNKNNNHLFFN